MTLNELKRKYKDVPNELKIMKRWVCFKVEGTNDGKTTKRPYNALSGALARVNDELTWCNFNMALTGCIKYQCDGIGFILGNGIFGIDLDNHPDKNGELSMNEEEFQQLIDEFVNTLDSYSERSQSGLGVHIICQGKLPKGGRRKGSVEMYDNGRFFAFTGNAIHNVPINFREEEVVPLWEKYVKNNNVNDQDTARRVHIPEALRLSDEEIIDIALNSEKGNIFYKYYHDGDISMNGHDQSSADMSFCNMLAFWCNGDKEQMDRIFRNSALMREKWDQYRGDRTYGEITIDSACRNVPNGYVSSKPMFSVQNKKIPDKVEKTDPNITEFGTLLNLDENGEPIFRIKKIFKSYSYTDTGNAERFYDYFGELFKYNVTDKCFMFWTGKTWIKDYEAAITRKYATKLIDILRVEEYNLYSEMVKVRNEGKKDEADDINKILEACRKNTARVANKAGKDALIFEFKTLKDIPVESKVFNTDDYLLNTESGIVNLKSGEILPYDPKKLISKNTGVKVSYDEPKVWLKFLYSVFDNGNEKQTNELIESMQTCLGYSLSGSTREQVMFLLYGGGSNGKSTLTEQIAHIMGDYADNIASNNLMQQKNTNNSAVYSIAKLQTVRFVETGETDDGGRLAEAQLKILTGGDSISAQFKFGNEFSFKPKFKIWMSTNNKPIIRGTDFGIWRRLVPFAFKNSFTGDKKDKNLPDKLRAEAPQILGWCIQGYLKYQEKNDLALTEMQRGWLEEYKTQMDVITQFILKECVMSETSSVECKELYSKYKEWSKDNTEFTIKESKFSSELKKKGVTIEKNSLGKTFYKGIRINGTITIRNKESIG